MAGITTYSFANNAASKLQAPLYGCLTAPIKVTSRINRGVYQNLNVIVKITVVFVTVIGSVVAVVPCTILYGAGGLVRMFSHIKINYSNLSKRPADHPIPPRAELTIDHMNRLKRLFDVHCAGSPNKDSFHRMVDSVQIKNRYIYENLPQRDSFLAEMSKYLVAILGALEDPATAADKKETALTMLGEGSKVCYPTWLENATKSYETLCNYGSGKDRVVRLVQEYKEEITLHIVQSDFHLQWHELSTIRRFVGDKLGLRKGHDLDIYANGDRPGWMVKLYEWLFMQYFKDTSSLIEGVQSAMHDEEYTPAYNEYMQECVKADNIVPVAGLSEEDADRKVSDYITEHFFDENDDGVPVINKKGVLYLLKKTGVIA